MKFRPANLVIKDVIPETASVRTIRFDRSLDPVPGQYIMVWVRGVDEIPMSFSAPDSITVHAVGEATRALCDLRPGDSVGTRGPFGNGFRLIGERILLIGGGVGVAPLAFLGEDVKARGIDVTSLIGFRCREDIIFLDRFRRLGDVILTTDDGSAGIAGRASAGLSEIDPGDYTQIYLCGPEMMMIDIIKRCREHASRIQACINRYFKCALGICGSCCLDPEGIRVCVEGPVITGDRLLESEFGRYRRGPSGLKESCY